MPVIDGPTDQGTQFLVVRSGGHRCAIPVAAAKAVATMPPITRLHGSAPRLLGLAQIGGEPVAVVDLHALLDRSGDPGGGHELTVVVRRADGCAGLGLAVDEAFGVAGLGDVGGPDPGDPPWVAGHAELEGRSLVVLDPDRFFADSGDD